MSTNLRLTDAENCATVNAFLSICRSGIHSGVTAITQVLDIRNKIIAFTVDSSAYIHACTLLPCAEYDAWLELLAGRQSPYWIREKQLKDGAIGTYVSLNPKVSSRQKTALHKLYADSAQITVFRRDGNG